MVKIMVKSIISYHFSPFNGHETGLDGPLGGARLHRHGEHGGSARAVPSESGAVAGGANHG